MWAAPNGGNAPVRVVADVFRADECAWIINRTKARDTGSISATTEGVEHSLYRTSTTWWFDDAHAEWVSERVENLMHEANAWFEVTGRESRMQLAEYSESSPTHAAGRYDWHSDCEYPTKVRHVKPSICHSQRRRHERAMCRR